MIIYTVCHINGLANACVLGDSIKKFHPKAVFIIGLVDEKSRIPKSFICPFPIIEFSELNIDISSKNWSNYSTHEFLRNTKPFFAQYIFEKYPEENKILFFSFQSIICNSINFIEKNLEDYSMILVPQLIHAGKHPDEKQALNTGIFHAGFYGLKRSQETHNFLNWWAENCANKGFIQLDKGMNAEQLWLELVPVLFENVLIEKHDGLNIGNWNLPERILEVIDNQYFTNKKPLISYDFSGLEYWKAYQSELKKYQKLGIENIQTSLGIPIQETNPIKKWTILVLKKIITQIDIFFDKF